MEYFLIFYWIFSILVVFPIAIRDFGFIFSVILSIFLGWLIFPIQVGATIREIVK